MGAHPQRGQATIELIAVLPCVVLVAAVAWQLALVGHAAWMSAVAARAGARADAVGRDAGAAARSALPRSLERGLVVRRMPEGGVRVSARVPLLGGHSVRIGAASSLGSRR
jgi:pilus assembly protein CpaE